MINQHIEETTTNGIITLEEVVISWLYKYYEMPETDQFPEIVINSEAYYFAGEDCEDLIRDCAAFIGLCEDAIWAINFPYDMYFEPKPSSFTGLYFILGSPIFVPLIVFHLCQSLLCWIFKIKLEKYRFSKTSKKLLTARHFTDIMVELLDKYCEGQRHLIQGNENLPLDLREEWRDRLYQLVIETDPKRFTHFHRI